MQGMTMMVFATANHTNSFLLPSDLISQAYCQ